MIGAERPRHAIRAARQERVALALSLAGAAITQVPALGSDFVGDDYLHFFAADTLPLLEFLLQPNGGHFMGLHKLVWLGLHRGFGTWPLPFFALALATHLVNTTLLFRLCRALGATPVLAGAAALLWGSTPLHVETLGWFSVYGALASLCAALVALLPLAHAAREQRALRSREEGRSAAALVLGAACAGSGVVVALVFPLVAALALPRWAGPLRSAARFGLLAILIFCAWLGVPRESVPTAVAPALSLFAALASYGAAALFAGPLVVASGSQPATDPALDTRAAIALGALVSVSALVALAHRSTRPPRAEVQRSLAFALPGAALYASVAWTRAWLVGLQSLDTVAATNRYHYAATALLLGAAVAGFAPRGSRSAGAPERRLRLFACAALAWIAASAWGSQRCEVEGARAGREFRAACEQSIRALARAESTAGTLFVENHLFLPSAAMFAMGVPLAEFPNLGAWWWIRFGDRRVLGRELRFVEPDAELLHALREQRPRAAQLFVSGDEVARAGGRVHALPDYAEIAQRWRIATGTP